MSRTKNVPTIKTAMRLAFEKVRYPGISKTRAGIVPLSRLARTAPGRDTRRGK
ncbi:MAG: hypothetical protein ACXIUZ_01925 [Lysobacteraceae bacterium]